MPYLRFSRDKRGYEHTFVVHADRRRGRTRTRLLYWFRTPPGVRVGRAALDESAIREIEANNPDVAFDWTRILKGEGPPPEPRPRTDVRERPQRPGRQQRPGPAVAVADEAQDPPTPPVAEAVAALEVPAPPDVEVVTPVQAFDEEGTPIDAMAEERAAAAGAELPPSAALTRLGPEGLLRLRARYAEVLTRIADKVAEPERREELKGHAERLNPDTWVTDSEVTAGLEQYETVFESLRSVVGRRRKRRRRRSADAPAVDGSQGEQPATDDDASDGEEQ